MECISLKCSECGAPLKVDINCIKTRCTYCGAEVEIPSNAMHTKFNIDSNSSIESKTDIDKMLSAIKYNIEMQNYSECDRLINAGILSFGADYRLYGLKAIESLRRNNIADLFSSIGWIVGYANSDECNNDTEKDIEEMCNKLVRIKGYAGIKVLHAGILYNNIEVVKFCLKFGVGVNDEYRGVNPVGLTSYKQDSSGNIVYDGDKSRDSKSKEIKRLLIKYGASKGNVRTNILNERDSSGYVTLRSAVIWLIIFTPAGLYKLGKTRLRADKKLAVSVFSVIVYLIVIGSCSNVISGIVNSEENVEYSIGNSIMTSVEEVYDTRDVPDVQSNRSIETFNNKVCSMSGKVWKVKPSVRHTVVEIYNDKSPLETVKCYFNNDLALEKNIDSLQSGDDVLITGICEIGNYSIKMRSCNIE